MNVIVINVLNPCIWVQIQIIVLVVGTEKISGLEQGSITNALYQRSFHARTDSKVVGRKGTTSASSWSWLTIVIIIIISCSHWTSLGNDAVTL